MNKNLEDLKVLNGQYGDVELDDTLVQQRTHLLSVNPMSVDDVTAQLVDSKVLPVELRLSEEAEPEKKRSILCIKLTIPYSFNPNSHVYF